MKNVSEHKKHLAYKLKELRKAKQLTQAQISKHLNIGIRTYQYYECEKSAREPSLENTIILAKYLNVSIGYLLGIRSCIT